MTDKEINEAVAERLGWEQIESYGLLKNRKMWRRGKEHVSFIPDYCRSIEAAWEIVEHLKDFWVGIRYKPSVKLFNVVIADNEKALSEEIASSAPAAICMAFLKLEEK